LERKDALKRIADPANLASDNPAIKAAAEIKAAEDMKKQKIKAIKYLAEIGCGCYDKDGKITEALLAATDDCTPDVRLAAVEAIQDSAGGNCCKKCGSTSCCSEEISKRLSEMAYERDDDGCPVEPSAEIRAAAKCALNICCPGRVDVAMITEDFEDELPVPVPPVDPTTVPGETGDEPTAIPGESGEEGTASMGNPELLQNPTADSRTQSATIVDQAAHTSFLRENITAQRDVGRQNRIVALALKDLNVPSSNAKQSKTPPLESVIVESVTSRR
jgi:hypothetical protein